MTVLNNWVSFSVFLWAIVKMCVDITSSAFINCKWMGVVRISGAGWKGSCVVEGWCIWLWQRKAKLLWVSLCFDKIPPKLFFVCFSTRECWKRSTGYAFLECEKQTKKSCVWSTYRFMSAQHVLPRSGGQDVPLYFTLQFLQIITDSRLWSPSSCWH